MSRCAEVFLCLVIAAAIGPCEALLPNATLFSDSAIAEARSHSKDWQAEGFVTRVKNQGACGSCWVFSSVANIETVNAISGSKNLTALSEQFVLDCISNGQAGMQGCIGGLPMTLFEKVQGNGPGFPMERDYEYMSYNKSQESCQTTIPATTIRVQQGYTVAAGPGQAIEDAMMAWVYFNGPVTVSVYAVPSLWNNYDSGILQCPNSTAYQQLDHAVLLVGYGVDGQVPYWKIKNSWTPRWGESGYIRLQRGVNACGVAYLPVVITVK